jgi:hypothetical protein
MRTMHHAPIAAALLLAVCAGCEPDLGRPVETVIIQDAGAIADADADAPTVGYPPGTYGANCTKNADCQSNVCFIGTKQSYCSLLCTASNAVSACAAAPFNGTCNMQGYCRLP